MNPQRECEVLRTIVLHRILKTEQENKDLKEELCLLRKKIKYAKLFIDFCCEKCDWCDDTCSSLVIFKCKKCNLYEQLSICLLDRCKINIKEQYKCCIDCKIQIIKF